MSTILDALRKLEEDKRKARQGRDPLRIALEPDLAPGRAPSRRRFAAWAGAGILILALAAGGAYWFTLRTGQGARLQEAPPEGKVAQAPLNAPAPPAAPVPERRTELEKAFPPDRFRAAAPEEAGQRIAVAPEPARPLPPFGVPLPGQADPYLEEADLASPDEFDTTGLEPDVEEIGPEEEILPQGPFVGGQSQAEPRRATALEERELMVSAVVWSSQPSKRFAVVNLKTVHEGDEVAGRRVAEIQEDGVVFTQGAERYKILLGRR